VDAIICDSLTFCDVSVHRSSVIFADDSEFGNVDAFESPPVSHDIILLPSQRIDLSKLSHLTERQRGELLTFLDRYPECFVDKPDLCNTMEHEIHVTPDFKPCRLEQYRVPEKFKPEVDRQVQECRNCYG
jgi:hypothetical protein